MPSDPEPSFVDRLAWRGVLWPVVWLSRPPPEKVSSWSVVRCLAGLLGRPHANWGRGHGQDLSFSSGPEAHAVAWYVTLKQISSL